MKITAANAHEIKTHHWYIDASELGIAPGGQYPAELATDLGNGLPFVFQSFDGNGTAIYAQEHGCLSLRIWPD